MKFKTKVEFTKNIDFSTFGKTVIIADVNIINYIGNSDLPIFKLNATEKNKNLDTVQEIYTFFQNNNVNRATTVIGIGGGITTDIAGFATATYMRGCRLILIPTTLLGMVDASIGGKSAVNFQNIKNNIGTFYPAEKIIVNFDFLNSLSENEMQNGLTEIIKTALIKESSLVEKLLNREDLKEIIKQTIELKLSICQLDLHDKGERRLLNLGHTFGHIIEALSNYEIPHGNAVAVGIRLVAKVSSLNKLISEADFKKITNLLDLYDLPKKINLTFTEKQVIALLLKDKKMTTDANLILFNGFQKAIVKQVSVAEFYQYFLMLKTN